MIFVYDGADDYVGESTFVFDNLDSKGGCFTIFKYSNSGEADYNKDKKGLCTWTFDSGDPLPEKIPFT